MGDTIRKLSGLAPRALALTHGPSYAGDCAAALRALADDYGQKGSPAKLEHELEFAPVR